MLTPWRARDHRALVSPGGPGWLTHYGGGKASRLPSSHNALELLEEGRLPPRARLRERIVAAEVLTYVREGGLAFEDSTGRLGLIRAGEFQRMSLSPGNRYSEVNASSNHWAHAFQIWLGAGRGLKPGFERRRFSVAQRSGKLLAVASPDARDGSLRVQQDVVVYSGILSRGQHIVHVLDMDRSAWLHVVEGEVRVAPNLVLGTGDGLSIVGEPALSLTAHPETEILLVDIASRTTGGLPSSPRRDS